MTQLIAGVAKVMVGSEWNHLMWADWSVVARAKRMSLALYDWVGVGLDPGFGRSSQFKFNLYVRAES